MKRLGAAVDCFPAVYALVRPQKTPCATAPPRLYGALKPLEPEKRLEEIVVAVV